MPLVAAYHRPATLAEATELLSAPNRVVLAGGTTVNADRVPSDIEVVDLQALGLSGISESGGRVRIGATTTLAELTESDMVPSLIQRAARAEAPSTLRTLSTIGGTIAAGGSESVLLAALLVHDTGVELEGTDDAGLTDSLAEGVPAGCIITGVSIDASGKGAWSSTARTPSDVPIVAAVARHGADGPVLALTGVAPSPMLVDPADPTAGLSPAGDFRGSSEYRLALARTLSARVLEVLS